MRVGGPAARLVTVSTTDELVDAVREVDEAEEPLLVVAGGSNLVIADGDRGTVRAGPDVRVRVESADLCGGVDVRVAAGEVWTSLSPGRSRKVGRHRSALGDSSLVGATPIQNVGAYGREVAQTIARVRVWDRQAEAVRTFANADCAFTYRHSPSSRAPSAMSCSGGLPTRVG